MFQKIIHFSLHNKLLVALGVLALIVAGIFSAQRIPLDAVPDITDNQVQIVTVSPTLAPQEVEQLLTYPVEAAMTNIPKVTQVRSISRYGLSVVTVVFEEDVPTMLARQYVSEQLNAAKSNISTELGEPEMMPITTGLGEIFQYVLTVEKEYESQYNATDLRTIQDWIIKRQLNGTKGIIEVSSFGGYLKQYEVAVNPQLLQSYHVTMQEVLTALENNNQNSGGSYIEQGSNAFYIRTEGRANDREDLANIVVSNENGVPILIKNIGEIKIGAAKRYGAMTMDGKGEVVGGITLMLKGANSLEAIENVKTKVATIEKTLPKGVHIYPFLDRKALIDKTIHTAKNNLWEGGLIVVFVLLLLLGNLRAGLIVASVIPLSMLFALILMRFFGVSANLMSLGAIDFGIVVDGAVIIVESILHLLHSNYLGKKLSPSEMDDVVENESSKIYQSAAFGVLIILVVFLPILTLEGIEGKTFRPMAQTVGFAILGSLILSLTYIPVMVSLFLAPPQPSPKGRESRRGFRITNLGKALRSSLPFGEGWGGAFYTKILIRCIQRPFLVISIALLLFFVGIGVFLNMGSEFVPTLSEGDFVAEQNVKPGSSLQESIHASLQAQALLLKNFPNEVKHVVGKTGTAEVPTDPMGIEETDLIIVTKDPNEWTTTKDRTELVHLMEEKLNEIPYATYEITQPIQMRFNELISGSKADIAIKIFGEDLAKLKQLGDKVGVIVEKVEGAADIKVDATEGLQQLVVQYNRPKMAQYGLNINDLNKVIRTAFAGEIVGNIYEQERKFDLVVRISEQARQQLNLSSLTINTPNGTLLPLSEVATVQTIEGPMEVSREQARRTIGIGVNVRNRDLSSVVADIKATLDKNLSLPSGYTIQYGGQYENLENAQKRLLIAIPIALCLILLLLYIAFNSITNTLLIFIAVPFSAVGGVFALALRDMPFSISAGVGFIALFGVAVLNGMVLVSAVAPPRPSPKGRENEEAKPDSHEVPLPFGEGRGGNFLSTCTQRLRPILMTALVAALGFIPMAISTGNGAEVQKPLATVVIGGLVTSTLLTLLVLPVLYVLVHYRKKTR